MLSYICTMKIDRKFSTHHSQELKFHRKIGTGRHRYHEFTLKCFIRHSKAHRINASHLILRNAKQTHTYLITSQELHRQSSCTAIEAAIEAAPVIPEVGQTIIMHSHRGSHRGSPSHSEGGQRESKAAHRDPDGVKRQPIGVLKSRLTRAALASTEV
jgi:hypothetical protein